MTQIPVPMPTALITGASVGIGRDLAYEFARDRRHLVLVARNQSQLEALATELRPKHGIRVEVIAKDLSKPNAAVEIAQHLSEQHIHIDMLVNNAGFGTNGAFADADPQSQSEMIHVNITSLVMLTRLLLPSMIQRNTGSIMNVASTAAFQPGPLMATYYASKAFVLSFSEALAEELRNTRVTVTALCPGPTTTEFQKRAGMANSRLIQRGSMSSPDVARIGYRGMMRGKRIVIPGFTNNVMASLVKFIPRSLVTRAVRKLNETRST